MGLKCTLINSQEPKESNDVTFVALRCIVFELSACKNSVEFPDESGCKANDLTRYNVDTARAFYLIFSSSPQIILRRGISASVFSTSPCKVKEQKSFLFGGFPERFAREIRPTQSLIANVFSMEFSN